MVIGTTETGPYPKTGMLEGLKDHFVRNEFGCLSHPLFHENYYRSQLQQADTLPTNLLEHFVNEGEAAGLLPHPIYDLDYVREQASASLGETIANEHDFSHFSFVIQNDISPSVLFSPSVYRRSSAAIGIDPLSESQSLLCHFIEHWHKHRCCFSEYFNVDYYYLNNPHLAELHINPLVHYFLIDTNMRADANHFLHNKYYRLNYQVGEMDALVHFIRSGYKELLFPNPYAETELSNIRRLSTHDLLNYIKL